jgi:hypothetical protein
MLPVTNLLIKIQVQLLSSEEAATGNFESGASWEISKCSPQCTYIRPE